MRCYYEELGISQDADLNEIRSAYRKLALRWHPDKNLDRSEEAKERFQLIQQAYEVLSDPHERAWYDNHREQILRGKNSNYEDNCLDLFQYFTVACFKGYGDDDKGFYSVYREVFKKIAAEDAEFMDDEDEVAEIPTFGDSQSSYEDVVGPFYAYWRSYCTKKSYAWLCPYDIQECKDRRVLRAIEKEMKKIVQNARRERNEEVRNLVSFIRKRDKRVQAYNRLLEEKAELNRQKQAQIRREQMLKRQRDLEEVRKNANNTYNEGYEEQLRQLEQQYSDNSEEGSSDEEADDAEEEENESNENDEVDELEDLYANSLFCVACNRMFKNERAFANHEASRKHRDNEEKLKKEMLDEEEAYRATENDNDSEVESELEEEEEELELKSEISENLATKLENISVENEILDSNEDTNVELPRSRNNKKSKKAKKGKNKSTHQLEASDNEEDGENEIQNDFLLQSTKTGDISDDDWGNSTSKKNSRKSKNKKQSSKPVVEPKEKEANPIELDTSKANDVKAKNTENDSRPSNVSSSTNHICVTCKASFESKNKLFTHLKKTNHGVYIPKPSNAANTAKADNSETKKGKSKRK